MEWASGHSSNGPYLNGNGSDHRAEFRPIYQPPYFKENAWCPDAHYANANYDSRRVPPPPPTERRFPPPPAKHDYSCRYDPSMIFNNNTTSSGGGGSTLESYSYYNGAYYDSKGLRRSGTKDNWDHSSVHNNQLHPSYGIVDLSYKDTYSDSRFSKGRDPSYSNATDMKKGMYVCMYNFFFFCMRKNVKYSLLQALN